MFVRHQIVSLYKRVIVVDHSEFRETVAQLNKHYSFFVEAGPSDHAGLHVCYEAWHAIL